MMDCGGLEYTMSKEMSKDILNSRKGEEKKIQPQKYLVDYVNNECNLLYRCTKVKVTL